MSAPSEEPQLPTEDPTPDEMPVVFTELPLLALLGIIDNIQRPGDLYSLCLVCRDLYHLTVPLLYANLKFYVEEEYFSPRLLYCLLLPGHDQKWGKWVKSLEVCGSFDVWPGMTEGKTYAVCAGLALVLDRIEVGKLRKIRWPRKMNMMPDKILIDALLRQKTLKSLEFWPLSTCGNDEFIAGVTEGFCKHITELCIWEIRNKEQLAEIARILKFMDVKGLGLSILNHSWNEVDLTWRVPPPLKGGISQLVSIDLVGFNLTSDPENLVGTFFNPLTLRRLALNSCGDITKLLQSLAYHPGIANLEELKLEYPSGSGSDIPELLIRILNKCRSLKVIVLWLNLYVSSHVDLLMQAIAKSGKTLEILSLSLSNRLSQTIYYEEKTMILLKSFEKLRELGMVFSLVLDSLEYLAEVLPRTIQIIDMRFPISVVRHARGSRHGLFPKPTLEEFATSFFRIHDGLACPELIIIGDSHFELDLEFFSVLPADTGQACQQQTHQDGPMVNIEKVDRGRARLISGNSDFFEIRGLE